MSCPRRSKYKTVKTRWFSEKIPLRDWIGHTVYIVENCTLRSYEIIEAPGEHKNYKSENSVWFLGKELGRDGENQRPRYVNIPWKDIVYRDYRGSFQVTQEAAIIMAERELYGKLSAVKKLRDIINRKSWRRV